MVGMRLLQAGYLQQVKASESTKIDKGIDEGIDNMSNSATLTILQPISPPGLESLLFHLQLSDRIGALVGTMRIDATWRRGLDAVLTATVRQIFEFAAFTQVAVADTSVGGATTTDPLIGSGWQIWQTLPPTIQEHLRQLPVGCALTIVTDDLSIPWELAYDGATYLGMRLCTTRIPLNQPLRAPTPPRAAGQWKALLLGNPTGDLPFAATEIDELDKLMQPQADPIYGRRVTKRIVGERFRSSKYHLLHYSGHAGSTPEGHAALFLAGQEPLTAQEIATSLHGRPWVVLNACNSAQGGAAALQAAGEVANLVLAFLVGGAQVVIGTQWPVPDHSAKEFSMRLYRKLLDGTPVAEAMRQSRTEYWSEHRHDPLWAAYVLFGAPEATFVMPESWRQESGIAVALSLHQLWTRKTPVDNAELAAQTQKLLDLLEADAHARGALRIERGGELWIGYFERRARVALDFGLHVHKLVRNWIRDPQVTVHPHLRVGVGIALDGVARHMSSGRIWGVAVARAWRLAQSAQHGEVLADSGALAGMDTRYAIQPWQDAGMMHDATWRDLPVMEVVEARGNLYANTSIPVVGERHQNCLAELDRLWATVQRRGELQIMAIIGPGGIGKSRLLAEWSKRHFQGGNACFYLPCPSLTTHYGVVELLLQRLLNVADKAGGVPPREMSQREMSQREMIAARLIEAGERSGSQSFQFVMMLFGFGEMQYPVGEDELQSLYRRFARTLMQLLLAATAVQGGTSGALVVMIDDCHLIDRQSASILYHLIAMLATTRCFLVLAHHPEWRFEAPNSNLHSFPLDLLAPDEAREYVRHHLSSTTEAQIVAAIAGWVPANPLALDQVVMVLRQRQILVEHNGAWVLTRSLDEAELPNNIKEIIRDRLRLLAPTLRAMVQEMVVVGTVDRDLLLAMLSHARDEMTVEDGLYELELLDFVREERSRNQVRFVYDVIAREIYHLLSPARRRDLHWRAMEVWSIRPENDPQRIQAQAAHVLLSLGDPLHGPGWQKYLHEVTDVRLRTAVNRLRVAADLAQRRSAGVSATTAYEQALAYGEMLAQRSDDAADRCLAADLSRAVGRAYMMWGSHLDKALESMDEAWKKLEGLPPTDEYQKIAAMIHLHTAAIHYYKGSFATAEEAARRGLAVAEVANLPVTIAEAANLLGVVHDMRADSEHALVFYARSADLYAQVGDEYQRTRVRDNQATTFFRLGDWAKAAELEQAGFTYWQVVDDRAKQAMLAMNMTEREAFQGRWEVGEQYAQLAATIFTEIEDYRYLALSYTNWGNLRLLQGDLDEAERLFKEALTLLQSHAIRDVPAETLCGLSDVARLRQHPTQALHFVNQALAVLAEEGDLYREEAIARRLLGLAHLVRGDLAQGDFATAATQVQMSLDLAQHYGIRFEIGRAHIALAELRLAQALPATLHLDHAQAIMQALEARPFLAQITRLREQSPKLG